MTLAKKHFKLIDAICDGQLKAVQQAFSQRFDLLFGHRPSPVDPTHLFTSEELGQIAKTAWQHPHLQMNPSRWPKSYLEIALCAGQPQIVRAIMLTDPKDKFNSFSNSHYHQEAVVCLAQQLSTYAIHTKAQEVSSDTPSIFTELFLALVKPVKSAEHVAIGEAALDHLLSAIALAEDFTLFEHLAEHTEKALSSSAMKPFWRQSLYAAIKQQSLPFLDHLLQQQRYFDNSLKNTQVPWAALFESVNRVSMYEWTERLFKANASLSTSTPGTFSSDDNSLLVPAFFNALAKEPLKMDPAVLNLMFDYGLRANDKWGGAAETPLMMLARCESQQVPNIQSLIRNLATTLLRSGADPSLTNRSGQSALALSLLHRNEELFTFLLEIKTPLDTKNNTGENLFSTLQKDHSLLIWAAPLFERAKALTSFYIPHDLLTLLEEHEASEKALRGPKENRGLTANKSKNSENGDSAEPLPIWLGAREALDDDTTPSTVGHFKGIEIPLPFYKSKDSSSSSHKALEAALVSSSSPDLSSFLPPKDLDPRTEYSPILSLLTHMLSVQDGLKRQTPHLLLSPSPADHPDMRLHQVKALLQAQSNPNLLTPERDSALHLAVKLQSLPLAQSLIQHGALLNLQNNEGHTPLMLAALHYHQHHGLSMIEHLLSQGAHSGLRDHHHNSFMDLLNMGILIDSPEPEHATVSMALQARQVALEVLSRQAAVTEASPSTEHTALTELTENPTQTPSAPQTAMAESSIETPANSSPQDQKMSAAAVGFETTAWHSADLNELRQRKARLNGQVMTLLEVDQLLAALRLIPPTMDQHAILSSAGTSDALQITPSAMDQVLTSFSAQTQQAAQHWKNALHPTSSDHLTQTAGESLLTPAEPTEIIESKSSPLAVRRRLGT